MEFTMQILTGIIIFTSCKSLSYYLLFFPPPHRIADNNQEPYYLIPFFYYILRINKPYLPIPSGEISLKQAWFLVIFYVVAGLLILSWMNANLITTSIYGLGLLLATMYSVPPFRLKRYSLTTSLVNSVVLLFSSCPYLKSF